MEMQFGKKYRVVEIGYGDAHRNASYNLVGEVVTPQNEDELPKNREGTEFWWGDFIFTDPEFIFYNLWVCFSFVVLEECI